MRFYILFFLLVSCGNKGMVAEKSNIPNSPKPPRSCLINNLSFDVSNKECRKPTVDEALFSGQYREKGSKKAMRISGNLLVDNGEFWIISEAGRQVKKLSDGSNHPDLVGFMPEAHPKKILLDHSVLWETRVTPAMRRR